MQDHASKAKHALAVYLERGEKALSALQSGNVVEAEELLRLRTAAFHNFRALDALALKDGIDLGTDKQVLALVAADNALRAPLDEALQTACEKTGRQLQKIREARLTLSSYRSQPTEKTRFESSV